MNRLCAVVLALFAAAAAAQEGETEATPGLIGVGGFILFYGARGPLSFATLTPRDLPQGAVVGAEVEGAACEYAVSVPISLSLRGPSVSAAAGDGGYEKALRQIREAHPEIDGVFDVRVDQRTTSVLGVWRRLCTEITAASFRRAAR